MASINLIRMNGLGNDFLIYDARKQVERNFSAKELLKLCSRDNKQTKGCDQFIIIKNSSNADALMLVYNSDSSEVYACGNASRCVIKILHDEDKKGKISLETKAGILYGGISDNLNISVDMGEPMFEWNKIPLSVNIDTKNLPIDIEGFSRPFAVSMGNPHMVFTTDKDVEKIDVKKLGRQLEHHPLFPERANIGFAQIIDRNNINIRVFERGAGETLACGTGACAAAVTAISRGLCDNKIKMKTRGGDMIIEWNHDSPTINHQPSTTNHVIMTGPVEFEGVVEVS